MSRPVFGLIPHVWLGSTRTAEYRVEEGGGTYGNRWWMIGECAILGRRPCNSFRTTKEPRTGAPALPSRSRCVRVPCYHTHRLSGVDKYSARAGAGRHLLVFLSDLILGVGRLSVFSSSPLTTYASFSLRLLAAIAG